jgi:hypothetical protein
MAQKPQRGLASPGKADKVEFENEHVRVVRAMTGPHERSELRTRRDRVLIFLTDSHEMRTDPKSQKKEVRHKAGEVLWRTASDHQLENLEDRPVEVIVVELKRA